MTPARDGRPGRNRRQAIRQKLRLGQRIPHFRRNSTRHEALPLGETSDCLPDKIHGADADDRRKPRWFPGAESGRLDA